MQTSPLGATLLCVLQSAPCSSACQPIGCEADSIKVIVRFENSAATLASLQYGYIFTYPYMHLFMFVCVDVHMFVCMCMHTCVQHHARTHVCLYLV